MLHTLPSTIANVLLIILGFGLLIFIHELGHFLAARWANIRTEGFAVGMGPVAAAWRRGIGLRLGSTARDYEQRIRDHLARRNPSAATGDVSLEQIERAEQELGIGETEYSLRWIPIGGFVKMLGQDDVRPDATSAHPRSYNRAPIGRRMVVISAGVVMNLILAAVLFIIAFMVGVDLQAPVVGAVLEGEPAAVAPIVNADEAAALGVEEPGLKPGDRVLTIDGTPARTFADVFIASAMARRGEPFTMTVERHGVPEPLTLRITPREDPATGMLSIGVASAASTTLLSKDPLDGLLTGALRDSGLYDQGVRLGMTLLTVNDQPVQTFQQVRQFAETSEGEPLTTTWAQLDDAGRTVGPVIEAALPVEPQYQLLRHPEPAEDGATIADRGLLGLAPLGQIASVEGDANADVLRDEDVILAVDGHLGPSPALLPDLIREHRGETIDLLLLREGETVDVDAAVGRNGRIGIRLRPAFDLPLIAEPFERIGQPPSPTGPTRPPTASPVAPLDLYPLTRLEAVNDTPVEDWPSFRAALLGHTAEAAARNAGAVLNLTVSHPTLEYPQPALTLELDADHVAALHDLGWRVPLDAFLFEEEMTTLHAEGNPVTAIAMGVRETYKLIVMTYLTIDRLVRGTVPVEQLRGPVGIVHLGTQIADRGLMYIIFFLAMISVNLAVLNFLPLPIVDGGQFLFLVYEKVKGRPPSVGFQNAAFLAGLLLLGGLFIVTFYNDVARLLG